METNLIFVRPVIHAISGRKKLAAEDLVEMYGSVPPKELASLGSKKVIDPERIKFFTSARSTAERICSRSGVALSDFYGIPRHKLRGVMEQLAALKTQIEQKRDELAADLEDAIDTWVEKNPGAYADVIRSGAPTKEYVEKRIRMDVYSFIAQAVDTKGQVNQFDVEMGRLDEQLLFEVAERASGVFKTSFKGGRAPSRKALAPLVEISEKLESLCFLREGFDELAHYIAEKVNRFRTGGNRMSEEQVSDLASLFLVLSSPDKTASLAATLHDGNGQQSAPIQATHKPQGDAATSLEDALK